MDAASAALRGGISVVSLASWFFFNVFNQIVELFFFFFLFLIFTKLPAYLMCSSR